MKTARYLCLGLILAGGLLAAPEKADASAMSDLMNVLNIIHKVKNSVPSGDQIGPVLSCLQDPTKDPFTCAQLGSDAAGVDNQYLDTLNKIIQMYIAIDAQDFWGVVGVAANWLGDDAPCILADVLLPGVGGELCGLVKELIATAEAVLEAGEAIVEAVADALAAGWDALTDAACEIGLGGCDEPPPPPPAYKVVYAQIYDPTIKSGAALSAIESPSEASFPDLKQKLMLQALASPASAGTAQAESEWIKTVQSLWSADVVKKVTVDLGQQRMQYEQNAGSTIAGLIAKDAKGPPVVGWSSAGAKLQQLCNHDFSNFAHYDRWIDQHQADATATKLIKNKDWCNTFGQKYQDKYLEQLAAYVDSVCFELKCATPESYRACLGAMGGIGQDEQCMVDAEAVGKLAAAKIRKFLADQSQLAAKECKIDGVAAGVLTLGSAGTQTMSVKPEGAAAAQGTIGKPGQVVAQSPDTATAKAPSAATLAAIKGTQKMKPAVPKTAVLDCPRPMHRYWCETKYKEWYGDLPLKFGPAKLTFVKCTVTESPDYLQMKQEVSKALVPYKNLNLYAGVNDPLLVPVSSQGQYDLLAGKNYFTVPPSSKHEFANVSAIFISGSAAIDGVDTPTLFFDQSVGIKKSLEQKMQPGMSPKPSPELGKPGLSPVAGLAQKAKGQLNVPALGPTGQVGSMDKATSTKSTGGTSTASGSLSAKAASASTTALPGVGAGSRMTPSLANQSKAAIPTAGATPQITGSGASAPAPATASPLSLKGSAAGAAPRSVPAAQSSAQVPAVQAVAGPGATGAAPTAAPVAPRSATAMSLQKDYSGAVKTFNTSAAGWKALPALQAAPRGCPCSALHGQITALDQHSASLLKEGESLMQSLNAGRLDAAAASKAAQRLTEISKQLDANVAQRKTLAAQYEMQLKNSIQQQQREPLTPGR